MKDAINKSACAGHARCATVAPEIYELDPDGYIALTEIDVPAGKEDIARRGAKACPERVIKIED